MYLLLALLLLLPPVLFQGSLVLANLYLRWKSRSNRIALLNSLVATPEEQLTSERKTIVGFFHPYCNAGGGGERVLWAAIAYLQRTEPNVVCAVYSGDTDATKQEIIDKVRSRFGILLNPSSIAFVFLPSRYLVDGGTWKRVTLLGQSFGSMYMAWEAMDRLIPDIFIDTMGYAFTFTFIRWLSLRPITRLVSPKPTKGSMMPIGAYVHYPTISTDMLKRVQNREAGVTNAASVANSRWKSSIKLIYYRLFAFAYSYSLSNADVIVANGTWTRDHITSLLSPWRKKPSKTAKKDDDANVSSEEQVEIVYPPCDTEALQQLPLEGRKRILLSVAQFRPEKNHPAQLRALRSLLQAHPEYRTGPDAVSLVLLGSVRSKDDMNRVDALKELAFELNVHENIQFVINATHGELVKWLGKASIGVSSMIDEHFGINVVEFMAAGLIPVAHNSGGPALDIVTPISQPISSPFPYASSEPLPTGYLYESDEYSLMFAAALYTALSQSEEDTLAMRRRAREAAGRFSTEMFEVGWKRFWEGLKGKL